jgi:hypothetical protein
MTDRKRKNTTIDPDPEVTLEQLATQLRNLGTGLMGLAERVTRLEERAGPSTHAAAVQRLQDHIRKEGGNL